MPVLHTEHSDHVAHAQTWRRKIRTRLMWHQTSRWVSRFCCVSEDIAASARRWGTVPRKKVDVVLNGIDTERYEYQSERSGVRKELGVAESEIVIGTVGRLVEVKRQDLLVRAFKRAAINFPQLRLLLVGDGSERLRLEALATELELLDRVIFVGYQSKPERYYQAMDVFALSSRHEGLPLALLEAWAAGVPVIAPSVGGIPKVVTDGATGVLFPKEDETALACALERLADNREEASRLATAGRDLVRRRYSLQRMAVEYEHRYRELIATI